MHYSKSCRIYTPWKQDGVELDHLMFAVKDAKKSYAALVKSGAPVAFKLWEHEFPERKPKMVMGFVKDPNGIWVGVRSEAKK